MIVIVYYGDIRYITHPQLISSGWDKVLDEIGICRETMSRVSGTWFSYLQTDLEAMLVDDSAEPVTPYRCIATELRLIHMPKLRTADTGI